MSIKIVAFVFGLLLVAPLVRAQSPEFQEQLQPPTSLPTESRVWKDVTGKYEIAARIVDLKDGVAQLEKSGGSKLPIKLVKLSEVDVIFARQVTSPRVDPDSKVILGKVVKILDGDTLRVANALESVQTIRLVGIDAPESGQTHADDSTKVLARYIGQEVRVEYKDTDRYKRLLGEVYCGGKWINLDLVSHGLAWHYKEYSTNQLLAAAEDFAKSKELHIWSDKERIAPWDFRNGVQTKSTEPVNAPSIRSSDTTVYITETGTHYHTGGCRHLKKSKIEIPLSRAVSAYTACKNCNPPSE